jgi:hypothetical protein
VGKHSDSGSWRNVLRTKSKQQVLDAFRDACAHPVRPANSPHHQGQTAKPLQAAYFEEFHRPDAQGAKQKHGHLVVKFQRSVRFLPLKKALLQRHGLASHWAGDFTGYWQPMRYCAVASQKKPANSLDPQPLLWAAEGQHPAVEDCTHERVTAAALAAQKRRRDNANAEQAKG